VYVRAAKRPAAPHEDQEVVILPEQRVFYIIGKKCGSSTTRHFFETFFGVAFRNATKNDGEWCTKADLLVSRVCPSLAIDDEIVNNYFIFGITRDPIQRFYSALKEANLQAALEGLPVPFKSRDDILRLLTQHIGINGTCGYDRHLESQLTELFTPFSSEQRRPHLKHEARMLPLDFVGSVDNLAEDIVAALVLASRRTGIPLDDDMVGKYYRFLKATHRRPSSAKDKILTQPIDAARDSGLMKL
jgi:hypothetical protein